MASQVVFDMLEASVAILTCLRTIQMIHTANSRFQELLFDVVWFL